VTRNRGIVLFLIAVCFLVLYIVEEQREYLEEPKFVKTIKKIFQGEEK
jgi:hypothetical protein